ncbi:hypothetical protein C1752_03293 [Acaryochloris thomasi RCC1774]|uniref:BON domain-containing protein n=1 Tax=Acaryochloris thomasi RCC1774 TaxID=1764569 RepID=A0A2W1JH17_9CYAN|nr:hypothetical protein C1752_03293 [Acaryochloris thomasi RCC1774]
MKALMLPLTTLLALSTLEAVQASEGHLLNASLKVHSSQLRGRRRHSSPQHFHRFRPHPFKQRRLRRKFPFKRKRVFLQPHPGIHYRQYIRPFPSLKNSHHSHREFYPHDYHPVRRKIRIRPGRVTVNPEEAKTPRRIYVNSVPELEPIHTLPAEFVGPDGQYDRQGLAKQITLKMGQDPELEPLLKTLEITQQDSRVIFKGQLPNQTVLDKLVAISKATRGVQTIETQQVVILATNQSQLE